MKLSHGPEDSMTIRVLHDSPFCSDAGPTSTGRKPWSPPRAKTFRNVLDRKIILFLTFSKGQHPMAPSSVSHSQLGFGTFF